MQFEELKKQSNLKVIFEAKSGYGKTFTAAKVVLKLLDEGKEVLYIDTEAEGSETLINLIEGGDWNEGVVERLDYFRAENYSTLTEAISRGGDYDLMVVDTLDHKHSYVLKAVAGAKRDSDADWNEYPQIYSEEKELMAMLGDPDTNIIATLDPDSGKRDKPKGAQTNIRGYFSAVIELRKQGDGEWDHKIINWVGKSDWIGKALPDLPEVVADEILERC